ncbi:response regulator transcription factor [Vallitalea guaymasensis]|uniref:response regulator transcription factor n=1 Tax=Vallitalea guaymasensis TaxID=1185412 RepID=UPI0023550542|nr:response regulator [Vallitalea guaymasensis]
MRILIADDEYLVRSTLVSMLGELGISKDWIDEVDNGEALVSQIQTATYDIAFIDIRMPKMNGLEAIEKAKSIAPYTKWVIVTGYSEFSYAKEAIQLGVSNYLLKPISINELGEVISELLQENQKYALLLNQQFESDMNSIYQELQYLEKLEINYTEHIKYMTFCINTNSFDIALRNNVMQKLYGELREKIKNIITPNIRIVFLNRQGVDLTLVLAWGFLGNHKEAEEIVNNFYKSLKVMLLKYRCTGMELTLIHSEAVDSLDNNFKYLHCIYNMCQLRILKPSEHIFTLNDLKDMWEQAEDSQLQLVDNCSGLFDTFYSNNYLAFMSHVDTLDKLINTHEQLLVDDFKKYLNPLLESYDEGNTTIEKLKQIAHEYLVKTKSTDDSQMDSINQIKLYVQKNYMKDIGIYQIADKLDLTPNYLSTLFKKKEGITFMKYLTKTRMLIAKELLTNNNVTVSQVANQVGFNSARYFSKLFKNYYNIYPSELKHKNSN